MPQHGVTRRALVVAGAAGLASLALPRASAASDVRLRMFWWGSKERADRTLAAGAAYSKRYPNVTINGVLTSADVRIDRTSQGRDALRIDLPADVGHAGDVQRRK